MIEQPRIPNPETRDRGLANLRRSRLELKELNLELAALNARLGLEICQRKSERVRKTLDKEDEQKSVRQC
ncbi:hypothetical protein [Pseudanabaena sp. PCC 6802]|uniref:hypothetical protein n=1 Tax=Pseudanabaena sp. PCC 6802 TaxID=118173 RepID=UPI0003452996|nr:hypothetical protein [Pseudanabaena sp. PCC 6802]